MKNGMPHIISQSEWEVNKTKCLIRETHPLDYVTQIYEKCVSTILSDIRTTVRLVIINLTVTL